MPHHHCYLLQSLSSPSKTYVGYTVNPQRRINQHNGNIKGGAVYTSRSRPWKFIAIVHGFRTESEGLKFEWAFQHPKRSKIFRNGLGSGGGSGSGIALAELLEKQRGLQGKLRLLMILLCESCYKDDNLNVYFFDEEMKDMFEDLFNNNRAVDYSSDESGSDSDSEGKSRDRREKRWCSGLPKQMRALLVKEVQDLPLYREQKTENQRKRNSKREKRSDKENQDVNIPMDITGTQDDDKDSNFCSILDSSDDEDYPDGKRNYITANMDMDGDEDGQLLQQQIGRLSLNQACSSQTSGHHGYDSQDDCSDSSGTIDLLDSGRDDKSNESSNDFIGDMDFSIECTPLRPNIDAERNRPKKHHASQIASVIDLTGMTESPISATRSAPNRSHYENRRVERNLPCTTENYLDLTYDGCESDDSSDRTIDLCSP